MKNNLGTFEDFLKERYEKDNPFPMDSYRVWISCRDAKDLKKYANLYALSIRQQTVKDCAVVADYWGSRQKNLQCNCPWEIAQAILKINEEGKK